MIDIYDMSRLTWEQGIHIYNENDKMINNKEGNGIKSKKAGIISCVQQRIQRISTATLVLAFPTFSFADLQGLKLVNTAKDSSLLNKRQTLIKAGK